MPHDLDAILGEFKQDSYAVRLSTGVMNILPFVTEVPYVGSIDAAAKKVEPAHWERVAARTRELVAEQGPQSALATADLLDKGDKGIALYSGVRGVYKAVKRTGDALETDPQQLADAALKAVGVAWMAWRIFPGDATQKAAALWSSPAGSALLGYYVAVDVALPFTDNVLTSGGAFFRDVVFKAAGENAVRLAAVGDAHQALGFLESLTTRLSEFTGKAAQFIEPITRMAAERLPKVAAGADAVAGVLATAADALSVYRYLGGQLVLEACLQRAHADVQAELAKEAAAVAAKAAAEREAAEALQRASAVKSDYALSEGRSADSLDSSPIKVTRKAPELPAKAEKSGCGMCGVVFAVITLGLAALATLPLA